MGNARSGNRDPNRTPTYLRIARELERGPLQLPAIAKRLGVERCTVSVGMRDLVNLGFARWTSPHRITRCIELVVPLAEVEAYRRTKAPSETAQVLLEQYWPMPVQRQVQEIGVAGG